jgi:hypothetical protein
LCRIFKVESGIRRDEEKETNQMILKEATQRILFQQVLKGLNLSFYFKYNYIYDIGIKSLFFTCQVLLFWFCAKPQVS